jgi:kynurenine 3-monooxygenase
MPTLAQDFAQNPTSPLVTIRCNPWSNGRVVLLGDAAHAVVPFYGQGANAAFEDCNEFLDALERNPGDFDGAIKDFEAARIDNANAIADLALHNFIEMRDHTGNKIRRAQKKGSQILGGVVPALWTPLYDMVSFTTTPYAEVRAKARRQAVVLTTVVVASLVLLAIITLIWSQRT